MVLATWIGAAHDWKPSTWVGYRGTVRRLLADPVVHRSLGTLAPSTVRTVMRAWTDGGMSVSTAALNIRVVKAASGWAYDERRLAAQPPISVSSITFDGVDDGVRPPAPAAQHARQFTGPRSHRIVPGVGHNLPQEVPEVFAEAVLELVKQGFAA